MRALSEQEERALDEFGRHFSITFNDPGLLKLALTHRSYLSVTGQGPRESNERLEFLGDSVLGLVTSEFLYRQYPTEHEGHLTKIKSLLVSKAILSRRALAMGLGRFVLMSHSEVESGGRQRLSILADAFEAVLGAIYLDQGFEPARGFIVQWLLRDSRAITSDERHVNYKSHLQEYVQSTYHTHPVYRIRSEYGPDHSKHFNVDVMVGRRVLGSGRGRNKKEAEQAAARAALDQAGALPRMTEHHTPPEAETDESTYLENVELAEPDEARATDEPALESHEERRSRRRGRRGGRGRRPREGVEPGASAPSDERQREASEAGGQPERARAERPVKALPPRRWRPPDEEFEEIGRPEGPLEERHVDPYDWEGRGVGEAPRSPEREARSEPRSESMAEEWTPADEADEVAERAASPDSSPPEWNDLEHDEPADEEGGSRTDSARHDREEAVDSSSTREKAAPPAVPGAAQQFGRRSARIRRPGSR